MKKILSSAFEQLIDALEDMEQKFEIKY